MADEGGKQEMQEGKGDEMKEAAVKGTQPAETPVESQEPGTNATNEKETNATNEKETNATKEKETNATKEKETNATKEKETNATKEKETNATDKKNEGSSDKGRSAGNAASGGKPDAAASTAATATTAKTAKTAGRRGGQYRSRDANRGRRGRRPGRNGRRRRYDDEEKEVWVAKTDIGKRVQAGELTDIDEILKSGSQIMETGIVDTLLPGLNEEVLDVRRVQRTLDSGRRMRFSVLVVVGDKNGHVGVGIAKGIEAGPTIKKAISRAKLNIIHVERGCASWECGCGESHTVPFRVEGKKGSVTIILKPAPKGVGLVAGDNSKLVLDFAGIQDIWMFSKGHTRTVINQALAVYDALKKLSTVKRASEAGKTEKNKA